MDAERLLILTLKAVLELLQQYLPVEPVCMVIRTYPDIHAVIATCRDTMESILVVHRGPIFASVKHSRRPTCMCEHKRPPKICYCALCERLLEIPACRLNKCVSYSLISLESRLEIGAWDNRLNDVNGTAFESHLKLFDQVIIYSLTPDSNPISIYDHCREV